MRSNDDLESEALKSADEAVLGAFGMQAVKEVTAQLPIFGVIGQEVISNGQQLVSGGDDRLLDSMPGSVTVELRS